MAALKKNIYSLGFLSENLKAINKRYLEYISAFNNKEVGRKRLEKVSESKTDNKGITKDSTFLAMLIWQFYWQFYEESLISQALETETYKCYLDSEAVK